MISIPSTNYGSRYRPLAQEEGFSKLVDQAGIAAITEVVDGMLYHNGTVMLAACETPDQRFMCQARAQILREMQGYLISRLYDHNQELDMEGEP